ncbi:MAG: hypothetical protein ACLQGV_09440 [Bryobacteraceae bacterium]
MKYLAAFILAAGSLTAADFLTGQGARAVIGQPTFTAQATDPSEIVSQGTGVVTTLLGGASGLAYANGQLFVADSNVIGAAPSNYRVLIFNLSTFLPDPHAEVPQGVRCPLCTSQPSVVLGQTDFTIPNAATGWGLSQSAMRLPTAVASDGAHLVVADTSNNRVLIWNSIPTSNDAPADLVLGQPDFFTGTPNTGTGDVRIPTAKTLRGPEGVWIQNGKLFVADDLNNRVLIWNTFPTVNDAPADIALGAPNLNTAVQPNLAQTNMGAAQNTLLNPVSVTSDGAHLFVADLGYNRVLIWNSIPTQNQQPADVEIGEPDFVTNIPDDTGSTGMCPSNGTDTSGNLTYPNLCGGTLNFPRFALSDGARLFIADGGNDRVLIFNHIPTTNAAFADIVLGQPSDQIDVTTDTSGAAGAALISSADTVRNPMSLAWDGANLYVSEPYSRRILVYTPGDVVLPLTSLVNAASLAIYAEGTVTLGGTITASDKITVTINSVAYSYTVQADDTLNTVVNGLVVAINKGNGDPNVLALPNYPLEAVILVARVSGAGADAVTLAATVSTSATETVAVSGANLSGGGNAAQVAAGTLISIFGTNLSDNTAAAPPGSDPLPTQLGGVELYVDGIRSPLLGVAPGQVNAELPSEVADSTSVSAYIRTVHNDGSVTITTALGVPLVPANPGIFAQSGQDPRTAVAVHASSQATGTIIIEGSIVPGDVATVTIDGRNYTYTEVEGDTLYTIRDNLLNQINDSDPEVYGTRSAQWSYIRLWARVEGPEGDNIAISASGSADEDLSIIANNATMCCANIAGAPVTADNPALPGETIILWATGLGAIQPSDANLAVTTGFTYKGPVDNTPTQFVSGIVGGKSVGVYYTGMKTGEVGIYEVDLELNPELPSNNATQCTIAQNTFVSNIVTIPVANPGP